MYTQCPDCDTAFRVTAEVLKQAAGKVRCGGCGNAFNALEYLSEQKPKRKRVASPEPALPELKPDVVEDDAADDLPSSISAEQSAALLKTLDELAGSDIRIEDTGVEWRVFDDEQEARSDEIVDVVGEQGEAVVDELLEEAPTPVDQFLTATPSDVEAEEIFSEPEQLEEEPAETRTSVDELRFDDNTPLPDDFDFDDELAAPAPAAEEVQEPEPESEEPEELQVDLAFGDSDDWETLLDEVDEETAALEADEPTAQEAEPEPESEPAIEAGLDEPMDLDTQFATQAEAMGIDLSGIHEFDHELEDDSRSDLEALLDPDIVEADAAEEVAIDETVEEEAEEPAEALSEVEAEDESEELAESLELELAEADAAIEASTSDEIEALDLDSLQEEEEEEHYVPAMSEEEQTLNIQIDQDLLALAVEDEEGFASTIVKGRLEGIVEEEREAAKTAKVESEPPPKELFESIVMEGETFRDGSKSEKAEEELAAEEEILAGIRADTRNEDAKIRGGRRRTDPPSWGKIAAAVVLVLLLIAQALHQSRDALATNALFNKIAGPLYRVIGRPLTPSWDVTGWNFEISKGAFDEAGEELTIYSRIGNRSDKALPYPLISVSLTDRFEETIGNKVLEPAEYLESGLDPRQPVDPGNKVNAAITIATQSPEATGFKLNVCYRVQGGQLRCDMQDFK